MEDILDFAINLYPCGFTAGPHRALTGFYSATDVLGKQAPVEYVPSRKQGARARDCRCQRLKGGFTNLTPDFTEAKKGGGCSLPGALNAT